MQPCNTIYYSKVYWRLNMFRAVCRSKHVEPSINFGIINSITRLHLVGYFYWVWNLVSYVKSRIHWVFVRGGWWGEYLMWEGGRNRGLQSHTTMPWSMNIKPELSLCVFVGVLFTFNEYSEFMASLVICIHARVGLWRMDFECPYGKVSDSLYFMPHCLCSTAVTLL